MKTDKLSVRLSAASAATIQRHEKLFSTRSEALEDIMTALSTIGPLSFMTCYMGDGIPYRLVETANTFVLMRRDKGKYTHAYTIKRADFLRDYVLYDGAVYSSQMFPEIPQAAVFLSSHS